MVVTLKCTPNAVYVLYRNELIELKESVIPEFAYKSTIIASEDDILCVNFNGEFDLEYQYLHKWFEGGKLKEKVLVRTKEQWDRTIIVHNKKKVLVVKRAPR
jgi:hypothetical protein